MRVRRALLLVALLTAPARAGAVRAAASHAPFTTSLPMPRVLTSASIALDARETSVAVLPGRRTKMWTFGGTFPGPLIRRPAGALTQVTVRNRLPKSVGPITVHHHGSHSPSADDGQPADFLIQPGAARTYRYPLRENGSPERAAIQWYHDHTMDVTGRNVWMGLAGMFIVDDAVDRALPLPKGRYDVPLVVVDRQFDAQNQIPYSFDDGGVRGDRILVNGAVQPRLDVATHRYRLRLLNASNERPYDFAFSDGTPFVEVGNESGLLPAPITRTSIWVEPAQRVDVVVDFSRRAVGSRILLRNLAPVAPFPAPDVLMFRVVRRVRDDSSVPARLRPAPMFDVTQSPAATRTWVLGRDPVEGTWTINARAFDPHRVDAAPVLGTTERWVLINNTDVDHVVHIHDVDWRVVRRTMPTDAQIDEDTALKETL
ncbi:MAG: multicopper oxidase domain-containing protein, partial [Frankia sp.]|nr:multicopper oxidase domain-containing protein [Frankia sp.]